MESSEKDQLRETVKTVRGRVSRYKSKGLGEQDTKASLIDPVLEALGWDVRDPEEVQREFRKTSKDKPVDYALKLRNAPLLFVEAKGLGQTLTDRKWVAQILGYATVAGVTWCVLSDGDRYLLYNATAPVDADGKLFLTVSLSGDDIEATVDTLSLLARSNLDGNLLADYWQAHFIDRGVKDALSAMISSADRGIVRLVRKRMPEVRPREIRDSLLRLDMQIQLPSGTLPVEPRPVPPPKAKSKPLGEQKPLLPGYKDVEEPLLRAIAKRGGSIVRKTQGMEIADELADVLGLTEQQRTRQLPNTGANAWFHRINWTKHKLIKKGDMEGPQRGVWAVTA